MAAGKRSWRRQSLSLTLIVPTLRVGMPPWTLRVRSRGRDAERHRMHSHAERGNEQAANVAQLP
ncbi:hypothetical protein CER19_00080 [Pseudomonas sp. GL93]|nr:hypothetical protein CER19_00080 [Pseudomonas sp. GL93]